MLERKYLAHFIDSAMGKEETNYIRLGEDLEEYNVELNPEVETKKNILGEQSSRVAGYEVSSSVEPFYYTQNEDLSAALREIVETRATGDQCRTTIIDLIIDSPSDTEITCYREDCIIVPTSIGGDTTGVQIPFGVNYAGNRVKGKFNLNTKKFTADSSAIS